MDKEEKIQELLTRGVERIYPSAEFLAGQLRSGKRLSLYLGIDPTGPTLHIGHIIPLLKLRQFQELGHRVILLIGDFTGMIGDPTDKNAARKSLTRKEVLANAKLYKNQAKQVISFNRPNPAELRYNSEWHSKISLQKFLELASLLTAEQLLKRDMFEERQKAGKPIYFQELVYPFLQGYDSVGLDTDGELGGNDQTFNMLVGRDLMKKMKGKEKFVVGMKLLADPSGKKMGKTEGNMVSFLDSPSDCFGKVMSWPDTMIISGFELCTLTPSAEIEGLKKALESGTNPKDVKMKLAREIVSLLHGESAAVKARETFEAAFSEGKPEDFVEVSLSGREVGEALVAEKIVSSKSDIRRLIGEGAITNLDTGDKMGEEFLKKAPAGKYRIGKHRFVRIR